MRRSLARDFWDAVKALALLVTVLTLLYWLATDLPLLPFLIGEVIGCLLGIGLLVFAVPCRRS